MSKHLILGCGFLGERLAEQLTAAEQQVVTSTRDSAKAQRLRQSGLLVQEGSFQDESVRRALQAEGPFESITVCVTNDSAEQSHQQVYLSATDLAIDLVKTTAQGRVHFVSTTGVYAPVKLDGVTVDETWPTAPSRPGATASLLCENRVRMFLPGQQNVFRLAGIYHPERLPNRAKLQAGDPIAGPADGWLNLIHADDAAAILAQAALDPPLFDILNVADGCPVTRAEFYGAVAQREHLAPPVFDNQSSGRGGKKWIDTDLLLSWYSGEFRDPLDWEKTLASVEENT